MYALRILFAFTLVFVCYGQSCKDLYPPKCPKWAAKGECTKNPVYMKGICKKSCNQCGNTANNHGTSVAPVPAVTTVGQKATYGVGGGSTVGQQQPATGSPVASGAAPEHTYPPPPLIQEITSAPVVPSVAQQYGSSAAAEIATAAPQSAAPAVTSIVSAAEYQQTAIVPQLTGQPQITPGVPSPPAPVPTVPEAPVVTQPAAEPTGQPAGTPAAAAEVQVVTQPAPTGQPAGTSAAPAEAPLVTQAGTPEPIGQPAITPAAPAPPISEAVQATVPQQISAPSREATLASGCKDSYSGCSRWGQEECQKNPTYMKTICCATCSARAECKDQYDGCTKWGQAGECQKNLDYMKAVCCNTCKNSGQSQNANQKQPQKKEHNQQSEPMGHHGGQSQKQPQQNGHQQSQPHHKSKKPSKGHKQQPGKAQNKEFIAERATFPKQGGCGQTNQQNGCGQNAGCKQPCNG